MSTLGSRALLFLLLLSSLLSLYYYNFLEQKQSVEWHHPQRPVTILLWHWPFGHTYSLDGDICLKKYNISRCVLTDSTSAFSDADVVVFHHQELSRGMASLPLHLHRPASQRWVWLSLEPPVNNANVTQFNGLFNWTMSYRRDADISIPYGKTLVGGDERAVQVPSTRSCLVSWVVSKYKPQQARAAVYQSLKKHIPIEVYGRWNKKPLANRKLLQIISNCLFYLSFENSEAKDYISEKFWRNALQAGAIPVVLGPSRATYEAVAPPHSFIHVSDFKSTAELAAHLKYVAANKGLCEEYFQWHHTHRIKTYTDWRERLCQICIKYPSLPATKVYQDLDSWVNN